MRMNVFVYHELHLVLILLLFTWCCDAALIASSRIQLCGRKSALVEPKNLNGKECQRKFVVTLTVENGKVRAVKHNIFTTITV